MHGASRESLATARGSLAALTDVPATDVTALSDDLAAIAALLGSEVSLRRLLTDPSRSGDARAALVRDLLGGKVGDNSVDLVSGLVRSRWSRPRDLADVIEELSVEAELALAERAGTLDAVEDDLFRFGRILIAEHELAQGLSPRIPVRQRTGLVDSLLAGKANPSALRLIQRVVANPGPHGSVIDGVERLGEIAAAHRERITALVKAVVPLTVAQRERLSEILSRSYGKQIRLNIELDPELIGGIRIRIGDDIIDGSLVTRLAEAAQGFAA